MVTCEAVSRMWESLAYSAMLVLHRSLRQLLHKVAFMGGEWPRKDLSVCIFNAKEEERMMMLVPCINNHAYGIVACRRFFGQIFISRLGTPAFKGKPRSGGEKCHKHR